jgi:hypothetical protein
VIPDFLRIESKEEILKDFPKIDFPGSVPLSELEYGSSFASLVQELEGEPLRKAIERKFDLDLTDRPTLITLRGRTRSKDGKIHADTKSKIVTLLLYFNSEWHHKGGRLRILRNQFHLDDYVQEISPTFGTCLIFQVTENCWHGHEPFEGERLAIQLNYLRDRSALKQHISKHQLSAGLKRMKNWFLHGDE